MRNCKKLLYVHVGKAAGTSFNNMLAQKYLNETSIIHIENTPLWCDRARAAELLNYDFISGHISLAEMRKKISLDEYFTITVLRDPIEHVASHLAWVKNMSSPGNEEFLAGHPVWVQDISRKLWDIDFSSSEAISHFFKSMSNYETALFDNAQSRYFLNIDGSRKVDKNDVKEALATLNTVDLVGTTEDCDKFLAILSFVMGWQVPKRIDRLNVAQSKYGIDDGSECFKSGL